MPQLETSEETGLLEAAATPTEEVAGETKDEFIKIAEKPLTEAEVRLKSFLEKVALARKEPEPPPPPPERTERQKTQLELEMEAGRKTAERHAAQAAVRPQPKPDKSEGTSTPVFRPHDYVPNLNSKADAARGYKVL